MTNIKDDFDVDGLFEEEEQLLREESKKIEEWYAESKDHFDQVKNIKHKKRNFNIGADDPEAKLNKKALPFIANQTANLNAIRKMKIDSINDIIKVKKEKLNLKLKIKQLGVDESKNADYAEIAHSLMGMVAGKNAPVVDGAVAVESYDESDFDKRIREIEGDTPKQIESNLDPCVIECSDGSTKYAFYEMVGDDIAMNYNMDAEILKLEIKYVESAGEYIDINGNTIDVFDE